MFGVRDVVLVKRIPVLEVVPTRATATVVPAAAPTSTATRTITSSEGHIELFLIIRDFSLQILVM